MLQPDLFAAPVDRGSLATASQWLEGLLTGELVSVLAVVGVALLGYGMMSGRIAVRKAVKVVLGCFILFGSSSIARTLVEMRSDDVAIVRPSRLPSPQIGPILEVQRGGSANPFDPYSNNMAPGIAQ